ncbi:MAG TPA: head-tail connector protein [Steroidobacteraceae bacterium]
MSSPPPLISLTEAKEQLSIDEGLTVHDARIQRLIGAAIDWAENFCGRSLGQLMPLPASSQASSPNDPAAFGASPAAEPLDSPTWSAGVAGSDGAGIIGIEGFNDWQYWDEKTWADYYQNNPLLVNAAATLRRDLKEAILMRIELMFDRNVDNWELLDKTTTDMLMPYRQGMGV